MKPVEVSEGRYCVLVLVSDALQRMEGDREKKICSTNSCLLSVARSTKRNLLQKVKDLLRTPKYPNECGRPGLKSKEVGQYREVRELLDNVKSIEKALIKM